MEIWETQTGVVALALKHANLRGADIAALGITVYRNQNLAIEAAAVIRELIRLAREMREVSRCEETTSLFSTTP